MPNKKAEHDALAKGAKQIREANNGGGKKNGKKPAAKANSEPEAKPLVPVTPSDKPADKLFQQFLEFSPDKTGVVISDKTPLEAFISIYDEAVRINKCAGFIVGDVIIQGRRLYGKDFDAMMAVNGRPLATLQIYADVALKVPQTMRKPWLDFTAAREVARLEPDKQTKLLTDIEAEVTKTGKAPTVKEIQQKSRALKPAKVRNTSTKGQRARAAARKKSPPPASYQPTVEEQEAIQGFANRLEDFAKSIKSNELQALLLKMDATTLGAWYKDYEPIKEFFISVFNKT